MARRLRDDAAQDDHRDHRAIKIKPRSVYNVARTSTKSFYTHHTQRITKAAVIGDAANIRKQVTCLKQRVWASAE